MVNGEDLPVNGAEKALSQAAIGRALGLSPASMTKLKKQGMPVDSVEAAQAWRVERQNVAARKPTPSALAPQRLPPPPAAYPPLDFPADSDFGEDRDTARTRREISEANIAEMTEGRLRRELIRVDAVKRQLATDYATTRDALMQIPARLAPLLAAESDPAAAQALLQTEIHQALLTLAGTPDQVERIEGAFE